MKLHVYLHFPGKFPSLKLCLCTPEYLSAWWEAPEKGGGTQVWNSPAHSRIQVDSRGVIGLGHELCQEGLEIETVLPGQINQSLHKMRQEMNWRAGQRAGGEGLFQALL